MNIFIAALALAIAVIGGIGLAAIRWGTRIRAWLDDRERALVARRRP